MDNMRKMKVYNIKRFIAKQMFSKGEGPLSLGPKYLFCLTISNK